MHLLESVEKILKNYITYNLSHFEVRSLVFGVKITSLGLLMFSNWQLIFLSYTFDTYHYIHRNFTKKHTKLFLNILAFENVKAKYF